MFLVLGAGIVVLIIKILIFPEANKKEFVLVISQASLLAIFLSSTSKYIKRTNTKFSSFYDETKTRNQILIILAMIVVLYFLAKLTEIILLFML